MSRSHRPTGGDAAAAAASPPVVLSADPCPCGRTGPFGHLTFGACCDRYLGQHVVPVPAPDAESLMRSRYTAYVLRRGDHLLSTWDPATRPAVLDLDGRTRWRGLAVLDHRRIDDDRAEVSFEARYAPSPSSPERVLAERSAFVRREGRWFYVAAL